MNSIAIVNTNFLHSRATKAFLSLLIVAFSLVPMRANAQWVKDTVLSPTFGVWSMIMFDDTIYASAHGTVLRSTDEGNSWQNWDNGLIHDQIYMPITSYNRFFLALDDGNGFPEDTNNGKLFRSKDAGTTWYQVDNIKPFSINGDALISMDNTLYTSGNIGLFRSSDSGTTWTVSTNVANSGLLASCHTYCFLHVGEKTFAGSDTGIFITADSGKTWNLLPSMDTLRDIRFLATLGPYIYAATEDSLFRSSDAGQSWMNTWNNYPIVLHAFSFSVVDGNLLVCSIQFPNIYRSTDSGLSWIDFGQAVNMGGASSGYFHSSQHFIYFDNVGASLYRRPLSDFDNMGVVSSNTSILPPQIQSYPNPLTQSTTINFTSPQSGAAEIRVVNLLGASVARIYSGELSAGEHSFVWDASAMPPGTYWCEIRMNGATDRIPIVIQR